MYARQDRKDNSRVPISASLLANMLELSGITRMISLDFLNARFFKCPADNLYSIKLIEEKLKKCLKQKII